MSRVPSSSLVVPFVVGAATALTLVWAGNKASERNQYKLRSRKPSSPESYASKGTNASSPDAVEELMDKPDLDHRMLRKAEAVIQWRTTRLVLVIERCTNDHNYSAILRTAEALGIQVVYMIDPPKVDDGDDEVETKKPQQQLQQHITRTPEEIEARRQHHLFARNAQEWLEVKDYATAEDCVAALRKQGYQLWVTDLSQEACSLSMGNPSIPEKVALVMGTGTLLL
jgi:tRNA G18 (ribose-2'-O)-methylase SpoU